MIRDHFLHISLFLTLMFLATSTQAQIFHKCSADKAHKKRFQGDANYSSYILQLEDQILTDKKDTNKKRSSCASGSSIQVPVAIHYSPDFTCVNQACLIDAAVNSISALNEDFASTNQDLSSYLNLNSICSSAYPSSIISSGTCIEFVIATKNHPSSSGITDGFPAITVGTYDGGVAFNGVGAPEWYGYLNIFVMDNIIGLGVSDGIPGMLNGDGVNIDAESFGGPGVQCQSGAELNDKANYNLGRTLTHEVGHYFGLQHIFKNGCNDGDNPSSIPGYPITDTPAQQSPTSGTPVVTSCGNALQSCSGHYTLFSNYMDYSHDPVLVMFTQDQGEAMNAFANNVPWANNVIDQNNPINGIYDCGLIADFNYMDGDHIQLCSSMENSIELIDLSNQTASSRTWSAVQQQGNLSFQFENGGAQEDQLIFTNGSHGMIQINLEVCNANGVCDVMSKTLDVSVQDDDYCACDYILVLQDSYAGWDGASLEIKQNGVAVPGSPFGTNFTSGYSDGPYILSFENGADIEMILSQGNYAEEVFYNLVDPYGNLVVDVRYGDAVVNTFTAYCSTPTCYDGIKNTTEYDVDCGRESCEHCEVCNTSFFDSGGHLTTYNNEANEIYTLCPNIQGEETIKLVFQSVDIECDPNSLGFKDGCWDYLTIYNGDSQTSPVLKATLCGEYSGDGDMPSVSESNLLPGDYFTSTDPSGCLTIQFHSDSGGAMAGWEADVICMPIGGGANSPCGLSENYGDVYESDTYAALVDMTLEGTIMAGNTSFFAGDSINMTSGFEIPVGNELNINIDQDPCSKLGQ